MIFRNTLKILAIFFATSAVSQGNSFVCNENGAVVTLSNGTIYYLGKNCDAARKGGGTGKWWLTASAFAVDTDGQAIRLPIEIDCPALPACWFDS